MLDSSQHWNLFGYDLRQSLYYVRAGWSEFLWGDDSPVLPAIDEIVLAHREDGSKQYIKAGRVESEPQAGVPQSQAVVLPDALVLAKTLHLPQAAEANLDAVIAMEVNASSPFPASDTCSGWRVDSREEGEMQVLLAISSRSAVMAHIAKQHDSHDVEAFEIWSEVGERMVMLSGFGEASRRGRNRRRLVRMATKLLYCALLLVAIVAAAAGFKYLELQKVREIDARVQEESSEAVELKGALSSARLMITTVADMRAQYPSPHAELERLAALLANDTWVSSAEVRGNSIRVEGQSRDASAVMQQLLDNDAYSSVQAPVAFTKQRSGLERFVLDLTLAAEGEGS